MDGDEDFRSLLDRVRQNDEAAATELVRRYEPEIHTMVRTWLRPWETRLRRMVDSTDICQSILAWFFLNGALERYDLAQPGHLRRLFLVMVRNRVFYRARRHRRDRRTVPMPAGAAGREAPPTRRWPGGS
jgi:hypothetical protein